jgi:hypothetical protein
MKTFALIVLCALAACGPRTAPPPADWELWSIWVEARSPVLDEDGHGPDIGSDEWAQAVQWRLGIVDAEGHGPDIGSDEWRAAVERKLPTR